MSAPVVLHAVTDPLTALSFLRGQLAHLRVSGFDPHLACERTPELEEFARREGVTLHDVPLTRGWWSAKDVRSLTRAVRVLRSVKPDVLNYSTPKAALIWAIATWFARPRMVVFLLRGLRMEGETRRSAKFWILWLMEVLAARTADVTVCVSDGLRQKALDLRLVAPHKAIVLGAGSASFQMLAALTERLPVMIAPKWLRNRIQPIAIDDAVHYLVHAADLPADVNRTFDIGGPDVLTYTEMIQRFAHLIGARPRLIAPVPVFTPGLASHWVGLVTPIEAGLARPLVGSLVHEVVCEEHDIAEYIPDPVDGLVPFDEAVEEALADPTS